MSENEPVSFGDNVEILDTDETRTSGHAGRFGQCYGFTTPSMSGVEVIGSQERDLAFSIYFESDGTQVWFAPHLVALVDHGAGTEVTIGEMTMIRDEHGGWRT